MKNNIIKNLRLSKGYSKKELAEKLGISFSMMEKIESNQRKPNDETKKKICKLFNVTMDYLMDMTANDLTGIYVGGRLYERELWKNKIKEIIIQVAKDNSLCMESEEYDYADDCKEYCIEKLQKLLEE